ncbi:M24 family metallopeptidase, partial [Arthrobacter sp. H5]|uniref:M24 family metallopeptidase n=1 Tax=Arthrobacter sp. H5 TaxID=1267973 RepID=UPI000683DB76
MNTSAVDIASDAVSRDQQEERTVKRARVLAILDELGRDSVLLTSHTVLTWYLGGSRIHISLASDPVAALLVDRQGDHLVTYNNEADRLMREELPADLTVHPIPWYGTLHDAGSSLGRSAPLAESGIARQLRNARQSLLPVELGRYEQLNRDVASALTDVLSAARPETTERDVAAALASRMITMGADPLVLLCNGASRSAFRHPLPTPAPLGRRAMAVVCARRDGMVANVTRWVRFDGSTVVERDAEARIAEVEADIFAATVPGARLNEVFRTIQQAYPRYGFGPNQWRLHHQGGPAG